MPLIESQPDALSKTYASSFFQLVHDKGGRELVEEALGELEDLLELARADAHFNEFLASRLVPKKARANSLRAIFEGKVHELTLSFLLLLNDNERLVILPAIVAALDAKVQSLFGRVEVDVFTAEPIAVDTLNDIRQRLGEVLAKEVVVHPYTDGAMIGGVKLRLGDRLIDASVATQLRKFRERLSEFGSATLRSKAAAVIDDAASDA